MAELIEKIIDYIFIKLIEFLLFVCKVYVSLVIIQFLTGT